MCVFVVGFDYSQPGVLADNYWVSDDCVFDHPMTSRFVIFFPVRHRVKKQAKARRGRLEDAKALFQLWEDHEEEEAWLVEKKRICQTGIVAKDLRALISLQQKHKVYV